MYIIFTGKPEPNVVWLWNNHPVMNEPMWTTKDELTDQTLTNVNFTIESLQRHDVHTKLTCQTSNFDSIILATNIELDLMCELRIYSTGRAHSIMLYTLFFCVGTFCSKMHKNAVIYLALKKKDWKNEFAKLNKKMNAPHPGLGAIPLKRLFKNVI